MSQWYPGQRGRSTHQNIGAYGQEVSKVITEVETIDIHSQAIESFSNAQCSFAYRNSIFKKEWLGKKIITHVTFTLSKKPPATVTYKDLVSYFEMSSQEQDLLSIRKAVLEVRSSKSMLLNPQDPNGKSAGSFFTNPILTSGQAQALKDKAGETLPLYTYQDGYKTSAAWLIENTDFHKGYTLGRGGLIEQTYLGIDKPRGCHRERYRCFGPKKFKMMWKTNGGSVSSRNHSFGVLPNTL